MNVEDMCFNKAQQLVESGLIQLTGEMDILQLTDLLINLEKEKEYKNKKTDELINYNDEIISIENVGVQDTVDISVSGDNLFYCNDILTKNSFGLPATVDLMFALISTEELEKSNHLLVKQLKNRYNDTSVNRKFVVGVNRAKMKLYDVDESVQADLVESGIEDFSVEEKFVKPSLLSSFRKSVPQ
jgi:hypothetical protein